ncbi:hypothetical protein [Streptococcus sp. S784/96/1]|uniref:hypothetical protein n=1 Tax=Streptococcus sp. S784/96/1 TaxID=2653499 RepID=UPI001387384F|nr:hypothetical protein [Streptococcus sp. S784/96/1]
MVSKSLFTGLGEFAYKAHDNQKRFLNLATRTQQQQILARLTLEDIENISDESLIYLMLKLLNTHRKTYYDAAIVQALRQRLKALAGEQKKWIDRDRYLTILFKLGQFVLLVWGMILFLMLCHAGFDRESVKEVTLLTLLLLLASLTGFSVLNRLRQRVSSTIHPFYFKEASERRLVILGAIAVFFLGPISLLLFLIADLAGVFPYVISLILLQLVRFGMAKEVNRSFFTYHTKGRGFVLLLIGLALIMIIRLLTGLFAGDFLTVLPVLLATLIGAFFFFGGHRYHWIHSVYKKDIRMDLPKILLFFLKEWLYYSIFVSLATFFSVSIYYDTYHLTLIGFLWSLVTIMVNLFVTYNRRVRVKEKMEHSEDYKQVVDYFRTLQAISGKERKLSKELIVPDKFCLLSRFYDDLTAGGLVAVLTDRVLVPRMADLEKVLEENHCQYALERLLWAKSLYKGDWYALETLSEKQLSPVIQDLRNLLQSEEHYTAVGHQSALLNDMVPMLVWKTYLLYLNHKEAFSSVF